MAHKAIKELNNTLFKGRNIILDFALGKELYEEKKSKEPV